MKRSEALPNIRTAAVVGSGTMGGGIAALLAGVGIPTLLLDIAPGELTAAESAQGLQLSVPAVRNRIVNNGLAAIKAARPAALFTPAAAALLTVGNLQDDFERLAQVDWVIEVIIENLAAKRSFYERLEQVRPAGQLVTSNTSGLPIQQLARGRSADFRRNFCGTHFFNPPRYLKLLEVIPTADTRPSLVQFLQSFGAQRLGKGVVLCKDTPNFIGNRIGGAANGFRMSYALDNGYSVEEADAIGGPLMGYPRTAVFRLMDLVGIDVAVMVSSNIARALPGDAAGGRADGPAGSLLQALLERKWLGNKTRIGFYKEVAAPGGGKEFWALDPATMTHTAPAKVRFESIGVVRKIADLGERLRAWVKHTDRAAQYVWHTLAFACSYSAARIPEISDDIASIDAAMRWGYMQQAGPFEYWDMLGVAATVRRMERDGYAVAPWVKKMLAGGHKTFYRQGARGREQYQPAKRKYVPVAGEAAQINVATLRAAKRSLQANLEAGLFDMGDGVLLLEFHGKANTLGSLFNAIDGLLGTAIGDQIPARTEAWTRNTSIDAAGGHQAHAGFHQPHVQLHVCHHACRSQANFGAAAKCAVKGRSDDGLVAVAQALHQILKCAREAFDHHGRRLTAGEQALRVNIGAGTKELALVADDEAGVLRAVLQALQRGFRKL